jgi:hypothetical protein
MGSLKSMKYGSTMKALHRFSKKYQNYGKHVNLAVNYAASKLPVFIFIACYTQYSVLYVYMHMGKIQFVHFVHVSQNAYMIRKMA